MKSVKRGNSTNLSQAEVDRLCDLSKPLTEADEIKIINSYGLHVRVLNKGLYVVEPDTASVKVDISDLEWMLRNNHIVMPRNHKWYNTIIYAVITDRTHENYVICKNELAKSGIDIDKCAFTVFDVERYK